MRTFVVLFLLEICCCFFPTLFSSAFTNDCVQVGAGAIGCEVLKIFAMMGLARLVHCCFFIIVSLDSARNDDKSKIITEKQ